MMKKRLLILVVVAVGMAFTDFNKHLIYRSDSNAMAHSAEGEKLSKIASMGTAEATESRQAKSNALALTKQ
ncbi:hypothetical protein [Pontibacter chitinilyticus]|uniref:hypothetical protein n=1 Tax=Pontibacter chitinilyticus TaxID=2674989 RepID=UPI00321A97F3